MPLDKFGVQQLYPTIANGREWYSTKWANGKKRVLKRLEADPYDSSFEYYHEKPEVAPMTISGNGNAYVTQPSKSYRLFVKGPWNNTEITTYVRFQGTGRDISLHSRSSHSVGGPFNIPTCRFAGYEIIWDRQKNVAMVECEVLDHILARGLIAKPIPKIPLNKWIGVKQITRTITSNGYVKVEGYMLPDTATQAWIKSVEYTFNGHNTDYTVLHNTNDGWYQLWQDCKKKGNPPATDLIKYSVWTKAEMSCWIRANDVKDVDFKYYSVREIAPL